jgi:hypothetical protein
MTQNNNLSPEIQDLLEGAFPAYNGDPAVVNPELLESLTRSAQRENYKSAMEFCSQFNEVEASKEDFTRLDWALSVPALSEDYPAVAEEFPELVSLLNLYNTVQIHRNDFLETIAQVILCTKAIVESPAFADDTIFSFKSALYHHLPSDLALDVVDLLSKVNS